MLARPSASRFAARWKKRGSPRWFSDSGAIANANTARSANPPAAMSASRRAKGDSRRTRAVWQVARMTADGGSQHATRDARVVQPRHGRAGGRRARDRSRPGAARRRRRRRGPAVLGAAAPRGPRALHAPHRPGDHRPPRRAHRAPHPRAGQAARRGVLDGARADHRRAPLDRRSRAQDPRRREDPLHAALLPREALLLLVRAAGRRRCDLAVELPVVDPVRRGRDGADGGKRGGAEARGADAAHRPANPGRFRTGGTPGGDRPSRAGGRRGGCRARRGERRQGLLHGVCRDRAQGRGQMRRADEGLRARARGQGRAAGAGRREPRQRGRGLPVGRLRERGPDVLGDRTCLRRARSGGAVHRWRGGGRQVAARGRSGELGHRRRADGVGGAVRGRARAGRGRGCRRGADPLRRTDRAAALLRADGAHGRDTRDADHARGDFRSGGPDRHGRVRGRGDRPRQRLRVRARRLGVDPRPREGRADRAPSRGGQRVGQRPHVLARRLPVLVGRREAIGARPLSLQVRLIRVREREAHRVGALARAELLVVPVRQLARDRPSFGGAAALRARRGQARCAKARHRLVRAARAQDDRSLMRRGLIAAALLATGAAPSSASAALDFKPCASPKGVQCATIDVPVDRSGNVPGTFRLLVHRVPARQGATKPPLVYLTGGPGQTNTFATVRAGVRYGAALRHRDLITFAQRVTGPTAIECPGLSTPDGVKACADKLGPARNFYTSRDAADDIDAIREQLGVDKVALFGASYGTWVEQGYAIRHPEHVETMVLDSTTGPNQRSDAFDVEQYAAAPGVARSFCHRKACRGITKDPWADFLKLYAKLQKKPLTSRVFDEDGAPRKVTLSALLVASLVPDLDVREHLRAELPRAVAGALKGDPQPLARLISGAPVGPPPDKLGVTNQTLLNVTRCEEDVHPFDRTASPADRLAQAHQQLAAIPPSTFDPFGPDLAFALSGVPACAYWPMLPDQPSFGSGSPANVPVLILHGEFDLRSTLKSTQTVASEFPQATVMTVANAGHSPTRRSYPNCARTAVIRYLNDQAPGQCSGGRDPFAARPLVPRSLAGLTRARAARLTVSDAFDRLDLGSGGRPWLETKVRGGGLRGGTFRGTTKGLVLHNYTFVQGFPVSGLVRPRGKVTLKVPHGTLTFRGA